MSRPRRRLTRISQTTSASGLRIRQKLFCDNDLRRFRKGGPMQTECNAKRSAFGRVEGRPVVAEFDGGALTSDAGGLLLGAADIHLSWDPAIGDTETAAFSIWTSGVGVAIGNGLAAVSPRDEFQKLPSSPTRSRWTTRSECWSDPRKALKWFGTLWPRPCGSLLSIFSYSSGRAP